jgi:DNA-binding CsgD family transcriptional regulator
LSVWAGWGSKGFSHPVSADAIRDFVALFPGAAHVISAKDFRYCLLNASSAALFGLEHQALLLGKSMQELQKTHRRLSRNYLCKSRLDDERVVQNHCVVKRGEDVFLNCAGFVVVYTRMKIPLLDAQREVSAILTLIFDQTKQANLQCLWQMYKQHYSRKKQASEKFLHYFGFCEKTCDELSARETDCLVALQALRVPKQAAKSLGIAAKTMESHISKIRKKCAYKGVHQILAQFCC